MQHMQMKKLHNFIWLCAVGGLVDEGFIHLSNIKELIINYRSFLLIVMSSEVEETLKRIQSHKGVKGVLIMNSEGIPIKSNLSSEDTENYAALVSQLAFKASGVVRTLDDSDELAFLRIRSKKHEIMIAPDKDYVLVVIQNPNEA